MELSTASEPLTIRGLGKRYGSTWALRGVEAELPAGQTLAVLGPSGCGKSTMLKLVAGLDVPDAGEVWIGDTRLSSPQRALSPEHRDVSMVFQDYALWPHMRVAEIIGYGLRYGRYRTSATVRRQRVRELVELLHLEGLANKRPAELSGGQQQRVSIARALATRPSLLLFDEPLSNLDASLRDEMREELALLLGRLGTTALYVTHDVNEALALADQILVLDSGAVVQSDTPQEVFHSPANGWVANLAGFSSRLRLEELDIASDGSSRARVDTGTGSVALEGRHCGDGTEEGPFAHIHPAGVGLTSADSGLEGTVVSAVFEGRHHRVRVQVGEAGTLTLFTGVACRPGDTVRLSVSSESVLFFGSGRARAARASELTPAECPQAV